MKRLVALLLLLSLLSLCGCGKSAEQPTETRESLSEPSETAERTETSIETESVESACTPILYKVTAESGGVLYLFGSIHATDSRAYPLPDYVMQAYYDSDYLAVECDMVAFSSDFAAQTELVSKLVLADGTTIADHIGQETYAAAKTLLQEHGQYFSLYDSYGPVMWMSLLESVVIDLSGLDANNGVDMHFLQLAKKENKEVREVESVEFQYDLLLSLSDALMTLLIDAYVEDPQGAADGTAALFEAWLTGDETALLEESAEEVPEEEAALYSAYETKLVTERNLEMADTAEDYLSQGGTGFFVVGAAHIIGEGACAELLSERGYTVERIG